MALIKTLLLTTCFVAVVSVKYSSKYRDKEQLWMPKSRPLKDNNNLVFNVSTLFEQAGKEYTQENIAKLVSKNLDYGAESESNSVEGVWPVKVFNCVGSLGVLDCLKIFLARRIERISGLVRRADGDRKVEMQFDNLNSELEDFKWEKYRDLKETELDAIIFKNMRNLIHTKKIEVILYPGVSIDSEPSTNGTVNVNIKKDKSIDFSRGMKFSKKTFYRIIPMLLIPPLIMAAILPFLLPAMKMMIIGATLLNNVALSGAVLTLMRNNVFQDMYERKVIYVNSGYKNEKKPPPLAHHNSFHKAILPTKLPFHHSPINHHHLPQLSTVSYDDDEEEDDINSHEEVFNSFKFGNSHRPQTHFYDEGYEHREQYSPQYNEDYNRRRDRIVHFGGK